MDDRRRSRRRHVDPGARVGGHPARRGRSVAHALPGRRRDRGGARGAVDSPSPAGHRCGRDRLRDRGVGHAARLSRRAARPGRRRCRARGGIGEPAVQQRSHRRRRRTDGSADRRRDRVHRVHRAAPGGSARLTRRRALPPSHGSGRTAWRGRRHLEHDAGRGRRVSRHRQHEHRRDGQRPRRRHPGRRRPLPDAARRLRVVEPRSARRQRRSAAPPTDRRC